MGGWGSGRKLALPFGKTGAVGFVRKSLLP
jgi:hypothetical protein